MKEKKKLKDLSELDAKIAEKRGILEMYERKVETTKHRADLVEKQQNELEHKV